MGQEKGSNQSHKRISQFIERFVRDEQDLIDENGFQLLFDEMSAEQLLKFWYSYSSGLAFSKTSMNVLDWKAKEQKDYFANQTQNYAFYPKVKDINGKYIIDKTDLLNHIKPHIVEQIRQRIERKRNNRSRPLLEKIISHVFFFVLSISIISFCGGFFFPKSNIRDTVMITALIAFYLTLFVPSIVRFFMRRKK